MNPGLARRSATRCAPWIGCGYPQLGSSRSLAQQVFKRATRHANVGQRAVVEFLKRTNIAAQASLAIDTFSQLDAAFGDIARHCRNTARRAPQVVLHEPGAFGVGMPRKLIR